MRIVGPIVVVEYDPAWAGRDAAEAAGVAGALGDHALRVEHVGSTSVPGLAAKPIIDVQVTVRDLDAIDRWRPALERAGYHHVAFPGCAEYPFVYRASDEGVTLAHVHLCRPGSFHEARHLALRDHLRAAPTPGLLLDALQRAAPAGPPDDRPFPSNLS